MWYSLMCGVWCVVYKQMMVSLDVTLRPFTVLDEVNGANCIIEAQHIADIERALRPYGVKLTRPITDRYTAVDFRLSFGGKVLETTPSTPIFRSLLALV